MSVEIEVRCMGGVECIARHGPSGAEFKTTAPVDNGGDGSSFSPTDLVGTALATCVLTIVALAARKHGLDLKGATAKVVKHMSTSAPRRIAMLPLVVTIPLQVEPDIQAALERAGRACPVSATLGDRVEAPITFVWPANPRLKN